MKNIIGKTLLLASALLFSITGTSCSNDDNATPEKEKTYDMSGFAKGADVSWLTEMEQNGKKFYDANGKATECMASQPISFIVRICRMSAALFTAAPIGPRS